MHRKIQDHTQAQRCLDAARRAGLTPGEWAREHGFDGRSLNAWRINLARSKPRHRADSGPRLIELVPSDRSPGPHYVVRVGDLTLEVPRDFDEPTLLRLIRALRAC